MKRRNFLTSAITAGISLTVIPESGAFGYDNILVNRHDKKALLSFGLCADLHMDIIPDGQRRLELFISEMNQLKPDFIIQLGDFCQPKPANKPLMGIWNTFKGKKYHVIGNHDTDGGWALKEVIDFWQSEGPYYSFDVNGYHFVVLNANEEKDIQKYAGPSGIVSDAQKEWLERDLENTKFPVMVFCHQGIDNDVGGVYRGTLLRVIFERANVKAGFKKVQVVFSGHHHQDYYNVINDIHYVQINSMSYQWMGEKYASSHYSAEMEKAQPVLRSIAPYADPIWATVTVFTGGHIEIKGKRSFFEKPAPDELNRPPYHAGYPDVPYISDRKITVK